MHSLQRAAGVAAWVEAIAYVVGWLLIPEE